LLQTVVLPLALRPKKSNVLAAGGTHVPFSPSFTYLQHTWLNILSKLGFQVRVNLIKAGYFPQGGGEISCRISPTSEINPIILLSKGELVRIRGYSTVSHLNLDIARRMKHQILERLQPLYRNTKIITQELPSPGAGAHCCIIAEYENSTQTFSSLGKKGKRAEIVADEAVDAFLSYHRLPGVLDQYSADQIVLPLAIAGGESRFTTTKLTSHLITNIEVIKKFLDCDILITGAVNEPGEVFVKPATNY
jgi:RNA 3'-terminal phosphate cyclase (ATP)